MAFDDAVPAVVEVEGVDEGTAVVLDESEPCDLLFNSKLTEVEVPPNEAKGELV